MNIPYLSCFLGYTLVNVGYLSPESPKIKEYELQRVINPQQVNTLFKLGGYEKGDKLRRADPDHALVITIDSSLVDPSCLDLNPSGLFKEVVWTANASKGSMCIIDGNHRKEVAVKVLKPTKAAWIKLQEKDTKKMKKDELEEHQNELERLEGILKERGYWLAKLYDIGE